MGKDVYARSPKSQLGTKLAAVDVSAESVIDCVKASRPTGGVQVCVIIGTNLRLSIALAITETYIPSQHWTIDKHTN